MVTGPKLRVRMARDQHAEIEAAISAAAGRGVTIEFSETNRSTPAQNAPADASTPAPGDEPGSAGNEHPADNNATDRPPTPDEEAQHPLVRQAVEQFGARVTGVHPKRRT